MLIRLTSELTLLSEVFFIYLGGNGEIVEDVDSGHLSICFARGYLTTICEIVWISILLFSTTISEKIQRSRCRLYLKRKCKNIPTFSSSSEGREKKDKIKY